MKIARFKFEMQRPDALKALDIYRRPSVQAERLSEFYEVCKNLDVQHGERYIKIEQPPASFLQGMEEYMREASCSSAASKGLADDKPKEILAIEYKKNPEVKEEHPPSPPPPEPVKVIEPGLLQGDGSMLGIIRRRVACKGSPSPMSLEQGIRVIASKAFSSSAKEVISVIFL